ncbi:RNA polymerase sigma factor [Limnoglobus roseus]|uniref:Sigma-70 family RNA polymerase sigma factor n=1 Tax=Limnoglobus roseus TaxID=2598579 RepID=A0A5C1AB55_9BACT|nr:sigma-70 family RNA polymerase sigma factor [Limnoglobus roseus]QEL15457.1 sigma-70 family RNA polymerase sigma factor [Limnoglobus roseus]
MPELVRQTSVQPPGDLPPGDHTLVRFVRGGDEAAAQELYHRYAVRLRRLVADRCTPAFAARFDPDDIVQSVFRVLYEGVRTKFYDVPPGGELWGLLFVLAVNKVRDQVAFHQAACRNVGRTLATDAMPPGDLLDQDETNAALLRLMVEEYLAGLDETDREIVACRMTGHSVDEIADRIGRAKRTVERVLQQARNQLTELFRH